MSDVFQKQIRVREFFFDFDKLRKGVVNEDKVLLLSPLTGRNA